jgi:hypothetical protein
MSKPLDSYSLILLRNVRTAMSSVFAARSDCRCKNAASQLRESQA